MFSFFVSLFFWTHGIFRTRHRVRNMVPTNRFLVPTNRFLLTCFCPSNIFFFRLPPPARTPPCPDSAIPPRAVGVQDSSTRIMRLTDGKFTKEDPVEDKPLSRHHSLDEDQKRRKRESNAKGAAARRKILRKDETLYENDKAYNREGQRRRRGTKKEEEEGGDGGSAGSSGATQESDKPAPEPPEPDPEPDEEEWDAGRRGWHAVLDKLKFMPKDYWEAFESYHRGTGYSDEAARKRYESLEAGIAGEKYYQHGWDWDTNRVKFTAAVGRDVLSGMYTYIWWRHGYHRTRLKNLLINFTDVEELAKEVGGFGGHVLKFVKTQEREEAGQMHFAQCLPPLRRSGRSRG